MNIPATPAATESGKRMKSWLVPVQVFVIFCLFVAIVSLFIDPTIPAWYDALHKPFFDSPKSLLGVVWTVLYGFTAVAAWLIWRMPRTRLQTRALMVFAIQFMLNLLWTMDFFYFHAVGPALFLIVMLWLAILWTTFRFRQLKPATVYLMAPYLIWVTFISVLNLEIAVFN